MHGLLQHQLREGGFAGRNRGLAQHGDAGHALLRGGVQVHQGAGAQRL
jgi:hypothetical protein